MNQLAVIALTQVCAMVATIVVVKRMTSEDPMAPASQRERIQALSLLTAACLALVLLTLGLFASGWFYKTHVLAALAIGGFLYLPFSTYGESDDDESPVPILDWVKVTFALTVTCASLAAICAYVLLPKL